MKKYVLVLPLCLYAIASIAVIYIIFYFTITNEIGLTRHDLAMGQCHDSQMLKNQATKAAIEYLSQQQDKISKVCGEITKIDYKPQLADRARKLGYKSSYYYSHWSIIVTYGINTKSGKVYLMIVQLADIQQRDTSGEIQFQVTRSILIDENNKVVLRL